ncbi:MAG: AMP-binding protein [Planctomycetota bacterium]|nr:AMP-binding protein [Planctomycetota bacterium]MDA1247936.1 AMP-binding protein [Planctomycetota bacterium]
MSIHPENLTRPEIEARQLERLNQLLGELSRGNSFWQTRLSEAGFEAGSLGRCASLDELSRLPRTHKSDLVADQAAFPPYGSNLTYELAAYSRLHQTSGTTTGHPMRWLDTPASWQWFMDCWSQLFRIAGLTRDDRLAFPFSFGPFIGFWAGFEGAARLGNLCLPGGGMSSQARLKLIADNQATVVCCTPTYALRLAEVAAQDGIDLASGSVRMLVVAGEPGGCVPAIRERIETAWGARVFDHWGMTELGALAMECTENPGGLHMLETECIVEIIDPESGESASADAAGVRRGELVITNLGRAGSPLIRYATGDLVETDPAPCPCGRDLLRLSGGILGRADDMIMIRGNNVFPATIEAILREFDQIAEFRIEVRVDRSMPHLLIRIEPQPGLSESDRTSLVTSVGDATKDRLNFHVEVVAVEDNSLPRFELKGRRFVKIDDPA